MKHVSNCYCKLLVHAIVENALIDLCDSPLSSFVLPTCCYFFLFLLALSLSLVRPFTRCVPVFSTSTLFSVSASLFARLASAEFSNSQGCIDDAGRRHGNIFDVTRRQTYCRQEKFQVTPQVAYWSKIPFHPYGPVPKT